MLSNYISYLEKLNSRLQQNGIYLDVRFDVSDAELLWEIDKLTQYLEFNHILMSADSNTAIYDLHGFTELSVSEFLSEKFKKEYEEEWNRVYNSLETTPIDAGKLPNKPIKTVSGELLADFMSQMSLSDEGYSNNLLASLGIEDKPTEDVFTEDSDYDELLEDFSELEEDDDDEFAEDDDFAEDADEFEEAEEVIEDDDEFAEDSDIMNSDADIVDDEWLEEDDLEDDSDIDDDLEDSDFIDEDDSEDEFEEDSLEDEEFIDEDEDEFEEDDSELEDTEFEDEDDEESDLEDEDFDEDLEDSGYDDDLEDSDSDYDEDLEDEESVDDLEDEDSELGYDDDESELGYDEDYLNDDEDESELGYDDIDEDEDDYNSKGFFSNPEINSLSENSFIQAKEARKPRRDKSEDSADALVDVTNKVIDRVFSDKSTEKLASLFSRKK